MTESIFAALSTAVAAFCIWLAVRIANRGERWVKWALAAVVILPVLVRAERRPSYPGFESLPLR